MGQYDRIFTLCWRSTFAEQIKHQERYLGFRIQKDIRTAWFYARSAVLPRHPVSIRQNVLSMERWCLMITFFHRFISQLLRLLLCSGEKYGLLIQKHIKELVGHEMNPSLYPILFDQIKAIVEKFFDQQGQVNKLT